LLIFGLAPDDLRDFAWMDESDDRLRGLVMMLFLRTLCWAAPDFQTRSLI
jgi:hypothetical protein